MADQVFPFQHLCGWRGVDSIQKSFAAQFATLRRAAPHLFGAPQPTENVLLYKAFWNVLQRDPGYPEQTIGDCVGFGHGHGHDLLQCVEIGLGSVHQYAETDTEFIYAASREIADILGTDDGSYGAAAVKAMTHIGMISRDMAFPSNVYSGDRAKAWGATGPPQALEVKAAAFKLGAAAMVTTWDELVAAISNGYPVTICTDQGFVLTRDAQGFCAAKDKWGHCMVIAGVRFDRPGACILQSWGPDVPDGPTSLGQPLWSFWAERAVVETILAEGDSWALSKSPGFDARPIPAVWKYSAAA
jgi:hypothetical protein